MTQDPVKKIIELRDKNLRVAIVRSNYHSDLTGSMSDKCFEELIKAGIKKENIDLFEVPGSWEIPLVVQKAAKSREYAGVVTFGVIVKGETYHFEMIANNVARALMKTSLKYEIPVIFEVLAVNSLVQAKKRAVGKYNKGVEAASALIQIVNLLRIGA